LLNVDCVVGNPKNGVGEACVTANDDLFMCSASACSSYESLEDGILRARLRIELGPVGRDDLMNKMAWPHHARGWANAEPPAS
jgi:hypothetical protein